jgi:hypothetical protein
MFFDLLNIKTSDWFKTFIDGKRLTSALISFVITVPSHSLAVYRKSRQPAEKVVDTERPRETLKLTDQYLALLVLVLTDAGLLDVSPFVICYSCKSNMTSGADRNAARINKGVQFVSQGYLAHGGSPAHG